MLKMQKKYTCSLACCSSFSLSSGSLKKNRSTTTSHLWSRDRTPLRRRTSRAKSHHIKPIEWDDWNIQKIKINALYTTKYLWTFNSL